MQYRTKLMLFSRQAHLRNELASTSDSTRIWRILRKEGLKNNKNNLNCSSFTVNELNSFYSTVACAHPPCPLNSLDAIVAPIQISTNLPECFLANLKDRAQTVYLGSISKVYCYHYCLFYLKYLIVRSAQILIQISGRAFIIPLNKYNNPQSVSDTRPIANLYNLAKVFDKIIATQISQHLETHSLLSPFQLGFRSEHNTQSVLLYFTDMNPYGIENNLVTFATLFDFRRAFDSIDDEALLTECRNMRFSANAIRWVHSYISGRTQVVVCNKEVSEFLPVTSGVPQGSSPGPIFFSLLINSLPRCLKYCIFSYILFADDLQLFIQCPANPISSAVAHMTEDASNVSRWAIVIMVCK